MNNKNDLKIFQPVEIDGLKRLGNEFDGGYVVHAASLADVDILVNYGVGYNVAFEKDFYQETGKPTLAFDPTLKSLRPIISKLSSLQLVPFLRHLKNYISWKFVQRSLPDSDIRYVEEGLTDQNNQDYKTLSYHFDQYGLHDKNILLKIDIEGAEYDVFRDKSIYKLLKNAAQILVEFHELPVHMPDLIQIMNSLSATHSLIHIHANNHAGTFSYHGKDVPETIEVTFLLNKYLDQRKFSKKQYPIAGLDSPCHKLRKDIALDFFL